MQATTWVDRITDERNPWLNAVKAEDRGDYVVAFALYIQDASTSLREGYVTKAALSTSCAAACAEVLGVDGQAKQLYSEAASLYYENARRVAGVSVRELGWSLWQTAKLYALASENERADAALAEFITVARRTEVFPSKRVLRLYGEDVPKRKEGSRPSSEELSALARAAEGFIALRRSPGPRARASQRPTAPRPANGGHPRHETSFVNQLG